MKKVLLVFAALLVITSAFGCDNEEVREKKTKSSAVKTKAVEDRVENDKDETETVKAETESEKEAVKPEEEEVFEEVVVQNKSADISVEIADELIEGSGEYDMYVVHDMNGAPYLAISTDVTVTDFKVNSLEYDYSNNGQEHIFEVLEYEHGELNPERPLVLKIVIPESRPQYDISYTDTDGTIRSFNILQSGETGEFYLSEITIG